MAATSSPSASERGARFNSVFHPIFTGTGSGIVRYDATPLYACAVPRRWNIDSSRIAMDFPNEGEQFAPLPELDRTEPPQGSDRRSFMMRSALAAAIASLTGRPMAACADTPAKAPTVKLDPKLDVVRKSKGPVMTTLEEFYKVGPGPSSSHTIGPMRITYDFYQRSLFLFSFL